MDWKSEVEKVIGLLLTYHEEVVWTPEGDLEFARVLEAISRLRALLQAGV
jgi:hypothetical protein